jgi:hypothetical protein
MDVCASCQERGSTLRTDQLDPICEQCYLEVRTLKDTPYDLRCQFSLPTKTFNEYFFDLVKERCENVGRKLEALEKTITVSRFSTNYNRKIQLHQILFPSLKENLKKTLGLNEDFLKSQLESLKKPMEFQKSVCYTLSKRDLSQDEITNQMGKLDQIINFINCFNPYFNTLLPLPEGEQQLTKKAYFSPPENSFSPVTLGNKVVFLHTDEEGNESVRKVVKVGDEIISETVFKVPDGFIYVNTDQNGICINNSGKSYIVNEKGKNVVSLKEQTDTGLYYRSGLVVAVKSGKISVYRPDEKLVWTKDLEFLEMSIFDNVILVCTADSNIVAFELKTGDEIFRNQLPPEALKTYQVLNLEDGRLHVIKVLTDVFSNCNYQIYDILGNLEFNEQMGADQFEPIFGAEESDGYFFNIVVNQNRGNIYIFRESQL